LITRVRWTRNLNNRYLLYLHKSHEIRLGSACVVHITYYFLRHVSARLSHHQVEPNIRENMHETQVSDFTINQSV
jgi:hypothetical protein